MQRDVSYHRARVNRMATFGRATEMDRRQLIIDRAHLIRVLLSIPHVRYCLIESWTIISRRLFDCYDGDSNLLAGERGNQLDKPDVHIRLLTDKYNPSKRLNLAWMFFYI